MFHLLSVWYYNAEETLEPEILNYITPKGKTHIQYHICTTLYNTPVYHSISYKPSLPCGWDCNGGFLQNLKLYLAGVGLSPLGSITNLCVTQRPPVHHSDPAATLSLLFLYGKQTQQQRQRDEAFYSCTFSHTDRDRQTSALRGVSLASFGDILALQGSG